MKRAIRGLVIGGLLFALGAYLGYKVGSYEEVFLQSYIFLDLKTEVFANGTWVIAGMAQAIPNQSSNIWCSRQSMVCIEALATLKKWGGGRPFLDADLEIHDIAVWNDTHIETTPTEKGCTSYTKRIDRKHKQVTAIRKTIDATSELCKGMELADLQLRLVDGSESQRLQKQYKE